MSFIFNFMGMNELHPDAKNVMKKYGFFKTSESLLFGLTSTIFVLFLIDQVGYLKTGKFMAVMILVQLLIDYPSGTIGDYIGQRWVLFLANLSSGIGLLIFAFASSYKVFIISAILFGFANAQASGALQSWLDNNYKLISGDIDTDRKNYGFTMNRIGTLLTLVSGSFIIIGGYSASITSRQFILVIQAVLTLFLAFLYLKYLNDYGEINTKKNQNMKEYFRTLTKGVKVSVSSKSIFLFLMGNAVIISVWDLWGSLMLIPIYFSYSGSDSMAGLLRSTIFFIGVVISIKLANVARNTENNKLPKYLLIHLVSLFSLISMVLWLIPPTNTFNPIGFISLIFVFTLTVSLIAPIVNTLIQRVMVDIIPSEQRNAIYSLIPTMSAPFRILILPFAGGLIETNGLISGVILVLFVSVFGVILIYLGMKADDKAIISVHIKEVSIPTPAIQ